LDPKISSEKLFHQTLILSFLLGQPALLVKKALLAKKLLKKLFAKHPLCLNGIVMASLRVKEA